ncbi:hypothetical protein [Oceanospirillum beijerinckii]|uniref:hypothetical protein n=1 Tax=Oceanospirillum beijerinckii TaxID=64976 RepID=UPI00040ABF62|nr:hypothetical protein [Oceanospirillum beijerinckii]
MIQQFLFGLLQFAGRVLLRAAMDKHLRRAVFESVQLAERSDLKGEAKMQEALKHVRSVGGKALERETESSLRTLLEQAIDHLKL